MVTNENKIATKVSTEQSVLYSRAAQFGPGHSIEFTVCIFVSLFAYHIIEFTVCVFVSLFACHIIEFAVGIFVSLFACHIIEFSLSLSLQRHYSPGWASASFKSFFHPSRFRATILL